MRRTGREAPRGARRDEDPGTTLAKDSVSVAGWTMVSRFTGVLRVAAIGAVLGPTSLGNTFQFTNSLPNIVYYGFLAGSLFPSLLVPGLVGHLDAGDREASERIAGGFLGVALLALAAAAGLSVVLGPLVLRGGAFGTRPGADGADQESVARLLLLMLMPQVLLYAVVSTSIAAMNASRRFALAAAAPALENLGLLTVLGMTAALYGTEATLENVAPGELLLLGLGATAAVGTHAAVQWWGARRAGLTLVPRAGWRDPDVTVLVRRAVPALGLAGVVAVELLVLLALANRVPGGVVAVQMSLTFYFFVVALAGAPVAVSMLPRLSRANREADAAAFHEALSHSATLAFFVTLPAAVGLLVLAGPLADVVAVGRMGSDEGTRLVATTIAALAPGIVGEMAFLLGTYASYARDDTGAPLRSAVVQVVTFLVLAGVALVVPGAPVPACLALAFSAASIAGATHLSRRLRGSFVDGDPHLGPSARRVGLGVAAMVGPVWAVGVVVPRWIGGGVGSLVGVAAAVSIGAAIYLSLHAFWRAPELAWMRAGLRRRSTSATPGEDAV
jgi:putative peptidoglycan lipid II flippase